MKFQLDSIHSECGNEAKKTLFRAQLTRAPFDKLFKEPTVDYSVKAALCRLIAKLGYRPEDIGRPEFAALRQKYVKPLCAFVAALTPQVEVESVVDDAATAIDNLLHNCVDVEAVSLDDSLTLLSCARAWKERLASCVLFRVIASVQWTRPTLRGEDDEARQVISLLSPVPATVDAKKCVGASRIVLSFMRRRPKSDAAAELMTRISSWLTARGTAKIEPHELDMYCNVAMACDVPLAVKDAFARAITGCARSVLQAASAAAESERPLHHLYEVAGGAGGTGFGWKVRVALKSLLALDAFVTVFWTGKPIPTAMDEDRLEFFMLLASFGVQPAVATSILHGDTDFVFHRGPERTAERLVEGLESVYDSETEVFDHLTDVLTRTTADVVRRYCDLRGTTAASAYRHIIDMTAAQWRGVMGTGRRHVLNPATLRLSRSGRSAKKPRRKRRRKTYS